ncbi:MAG: signal peptidase I [Mariprofundaceae bacterium]
MSYKEKSAWREWGESLLIVAALAICIRSFIVAPFKIPSSSMLPTLEVGDYIFVLRFPYGLRIPMTDIQLFADAPERGDVAVFDFPEDRSIDYIKRIIGLPGDVVRYDKNHLFVNGEEVPREYIGERAYIMAAGGVDVSSHFVENLPPGVDHSMLVKTNSIRDGEWTVPEEQYFALGDNRNNSRDSRFWGFVPQSHLVGRAVIIWWSWDGHNKQVRWDRLGSLLH